MAEHEEPLEDWAARRDARRPRLGERRPAPLGDEQHGTHVDPDAPRGVEVWDGQGWVPSGVAEDHEAAAAETGGDTAVRAEQVPLPAFGRLPTMPKPYRPTIPFHRPRA
ncbi:DUF6087 family protein [Streptomyces griseoluteus]|uniref:DUF6087 family protein n=1 Tax=Streptomyces griseoluteus TaxID=29306 RepID=UPI0036830E3E